MKKVKVIDLFNVKFDMMESTVNNELKKLQRKVEKTFVNDDELIGVSCYKSRVALALKLQEKKGGK